MNKTPDWSEVVRHLNALYDASDGLERIFDGRKFTLDGHLVGSIGEVIAAYIFDLQLNVASTMRHDATSSDGRNVEIKFTQGTGVAIRHEPDHLIVLQRRKHGPVKIAYNGPGKLAWEHAGRMQSNGQRPISIAQLMKLDQQVSDTDRLPIMRKPPI